jgi:hypothetical protein
MPLFLSWDYNGCSLNTLLDGKIKATWLSMIGKLAAELELIAMAESETLQTKHGS